MKNKFILIFLIHLILIKCTNNLFAQIDVNRKSKTEKTDTISKNADSKSFDDLPYFDNYEKPPPIPNFRESQSTENFTQHKSLNNDVNVIIKNAHYGLTKKDRILIPPIFNQYEYYTKEKYLNDKIILKFDDFYGIYDFNKEKWIIPLRYFSLKILDENKILANKDRKIGIIDFNNNILHEFEWAEFITHVNYPYISTASNTPPLLFGLFDIINLKYSIPMIYTSIDEITKKNRYIVKNLDGKKSKVISPSFEFSFQNWYDNLKYINKENIIAVKNNIYGIIDTNENIILPFNYNYLDFYKDSLYIAKDKYNKYGFISLSGKIKVPFEYDLLVIHGKLILTNNGDKYGVSKITNDSMIEILKCENDLIYFENSSATYKIQKDGKYGLMDYEGKIKFPIENDSIEIIDKYRSELIFVYKDKKINAYNNYIKINSPIMKSIKKLYENNNFRNLAECFKYEGANNRYGILNTYFREITPPLFEDLEYATNSLIIFKEKNKYGIYNYNDKKELITPIYDQIIFTNKGFIGLKDNIFYSIDINDPSKTIKLN